MLDHSDAVTAIGTGVMASLADVGLPEPLASVVDYLGDDLTERDFVPTAELIEELDVEATAFGAGMGEFGCRPTRQYVQDGDNTRRVRGYITADIRAAIAEISSSDESS